MALYRRGRIWCYRFQFQGRRIQESSGFTNKTAALRVEAKRKADLLDRRAGFTKAKLVPKFEEHVEQFLLWSKQQHKTKTHALHGWNCKTLKRFSAANISMKLQAKWWKTSNQRASTR